MKLTEREHLFTILSSKLDKEEAEELEKQISVFIMEMRRDRIKEYIAINNQLLEGRLKEGVRNDELYSIGASRILKIKNNSFSDEILEINENIITLLK